MKVSRASKEKYLDHLPAVGLSFATICWGASFFLVKKAVLLVGIWPFLFWRFTLASLFMSLAFPNKLTNAKETTIHRGLILGGLLFTALWTQTEGLQFITAGKSSFLTALYVPFVPLLGWILFRKKVNYRHFLVAMSSVAGLYLLAQPKAGGHINAGDMWTVLTAMIWACHILCTEKFTREDPDSFGLALWQVVGCWGFVMVGTVFEVGADHMAPVRWNIMSWPSFAIGSAIFNALFATCFGFIIQVVCQKTLGALKASLIFALEAPFATIFAFLFLDEILTPKEFIGALIVLLVSIVPETWLKGGKNGTS